MMTYHQVKMYLMSLIKCPSCQKQISDKVELCPHCDYSFNQSEDDIERLKVLKFRDYRNKMFRFKMLTFTAMSIAIIGLVPMLWTYAKAIDYGFNASFLNHWGIYLIFIGFALYVIVRILMFITKNNYKTRI